MGTSDGLVPVSGGGRGLPSTLPGQVLDCPGGVGESRGLLAGARRDDCRAQSQKVALKCDLVYDAPDLRSAPARPTGFVHRWHSLLHEGIEMVQVLGGEDP